MERRLTTILSADVVGYSRLMAADEAGTLTSLKAIRRELIEPKTAEHNGRVVKLMGDGTLMEFGSVVDAVNFAVDVQQVMAARNTKVHEDRRITFRTGINIGDVILEGDDLYGDGVNVAARLEGAAEPGGVCVSRTVAEQVEGMHSARASRSPISSGSIADSSDLMRTAPNMSRRFGKLESPKAATGAWISAAATNAAPSTAFTFVSAVRIYRCFRLAAECPGRVIGTRSQRPGIGSGYPQ
jgi:adenylate cyclase